MSISGCFFIQRIIDNLFDIVAVCKSKVLIYIYFFNFPQRYIFTAAVSHRFISPFF